MSHDTTTEEGRLKRQDQFDQPRVKKLADLYSETGNKKYLAMAEAQFGNADFISGFDDGEGPRGSNND